MNVQSDHSLRLKVKCAKFHQDRDKIVGLHERHMKVHSHAFRPS